MQNRKSAPRRRLSRRQQFIGELVANGGNASAAARAVGFHPDHGRRLVSRDATVRATLERMHQQTEAELQEWIELAPQAQRVLVDLLDSDDDRVRLQAAVHILDRALGKVAQKVDATITTRESLSEVELQAALSLVAARGMTFAESAKYVREHPDEVGAWAAAEIRNHSPHHALRPALEDGG